MSCVSNHRSLFVHRDEWPGKARNGSGTAIQMAMERATVLLGRNEGLKQDIGGDDPRT